MATGLSLRLFSPNTLSQYSSTLSARFHSAKAKRKEGRTPRKKSKNVVIRGDSDIISPPDDLSNLRRVKFYVTSNEPEIEKRFRVEHEKVQDWNEKFWREHNARFVKESKAFQKDRLQSCADEEKKTLNAEEMSEFYKAYLDKNWNHHVWYNFEWYCKNVYLVFLAWRVQMNKMRNIFRKKSHIKN